MNLAKIKTIGITFFVTSALFTCSMTDKDAEINECEEAQENLTTSYEQLEARFSQSQSRLTRAQNRVEELEGLPFMRLSAATESLANENRSDARRQLQELLELYPDSEEAGVAAEHLATLERQLEEERAAQAAAAAERTRLAQQSYARLERDRSPEIGGVSFRFDYPVNSRRFVFDRYGDRYHYNEATRGHDMMSVGVRVTSPNSQNPTLPALKLCVVRNGSAQCGWSVDWRLYRWRDYGAYLGNYSDNNNDFRHNETVRFAAGGLFPEPVDGTDVYLVASRQSCVQRNYNRWDNPPVSYASSNCNSDVMFSTAEALSEQYIVISKIN